MRLRVGRKPPLFPCGWCGDGADQRITTESAFLGQMSDRVGGLDGADVGLLPTDLVGKYALVDYIHIDILYYISYPTDQGIIFPCPS